MEIDIDELLDLSHEEQKSKLRVRENLKYFNYTGCFECIILYEVCVFEYSKYISLSTDSNLKKKIRLNFLFSCFPKAVLHECGKPKEVRRHLKKDMNANKNQNDRPTKTPIV